MVTYNPKDWLKLIFHFHKSDTLRILGPNMIILGIITAGFCYLEENYFSSKIPSLTIFHQISGFIISLVLVFRINTAYDRWWEGRKLWGVLINNSRSISIELHSMIPLDDIYTRSKIVSFLSSFAFMLKEHLRNNYKPAELSFNDSMHEAELTASSHKPSFIAARFSRFIYEYCRQNSGDQNNFLIVERNINEFSEICGACERIKSTPIPYSYSIFIKKLVFIYIITMPITFGLSVGYWSIPMVMVIFYAFASLELLSEEIEDPFGTDSNDLPTDEIAAKIKDNVTEILLANAKN